MRRPIEQCYWVEPGRLLAGEYPGGRVEYQAQEKVDALLGAGVTTFIDLTEEHELKPYAHLIGAAAHHRFPIPDLSIPESPELTARILDAIDRELDREQLVYVHCWGGVGRTGVIIGCWLARHGFKGDTALTRLHELWQRCPKSASRLSPETPEQERYVRAWEPGR